MLFRVFWRSRRVVQLVFDKPGSFFKGNIHSHSSNSDGLLSPRDVACAYHERGYDFIAITDHFIARYGFPVTDTSCLRTSEFTTLTGIEMHGPGLQNGIIWDLLAIGVPLDFAHATHGEDGPSLARRAQAAGAFVAIPHPAWNGVVHSDALTLIDHVDAVEIHNEGHTLDSDRGSGWFLADSLSTAGYRISGFAADDAHFKTDRHDRFGGWVYVKAESLEPEPLLAALKAGDYYASTGAAIHNVVVTSTEIVVECSPAVGVMVGGAGTARSYKRGDGITRATFPRGMFEHAFFRVIVVQKDGRKAWTSPIWFS
jgi:hypothetical protein